MIGGTVRHLLQALWLSLVERRARILAHEPRRADLEILTGLYEEGSLRPVIGRVCELAEVPETLERLGAGRSWGRP